MIKVYIRTLGRRLKCKFS